jgi:vacuolar protein sorting-associated protein 13B
MNYHSNIAKRASITRLDLHCQKMEFSITEQQIPMILRLIALLTLLQSRQLPIVKEKSRASTEEDDSSSKGSSKLYKIFIWILPIKMYLLLEFSNR